MNKLLFSACCLIIFLKSNAQTLLNENFNYSPGQLSAAFSGANVSNGTWINFSGTANPILCDSGSLSYANYVSSGIGNKAKLTAVSTSAEDIYTGFSAQSSGTIFTSFILNVSDTNRILANTNANGDYFLALLPSTSTNSFFSRLSIKKSLSGSGYILGIRGNSSATTIFASTELSVGTSYLIVMQYKVVTGTSNDSVTLWINPTLSSNTPTPDINERVSAGTDPADLGRLALRQGVNTPNCFVDGIRVALSWSDLLGLNTVTYNPTTEINATPNFITTANITWKLPNGYDATSSEIVVFAKADNPIAIGSPSKSVINYNASAVLGTGSTFENDALAFCVYKGDLNNVAISNLQSNKRYYLAAFAVTTTDSIYSTADTVSFIQNTAPPEAVTDINTTGLTGTTMRITWQKNANYNNSKFTTLVFVKATNPINIGTPTKSPLRYPNASGFFNIGTKYQNDSLASCVFRGDTNFVNVSNLNNTITYHVSVLVVEDFDSVYSAPASSSGGPLAPPPLVEINKINSINLSTGAPDSAGKYVRLSGVVHGFNQRTNGLQFMLHDGTGGITVFSNNRTYGYTVAEGDSVTIQGIVASNRGLLIIANLDTVLLQGSGKALKTPIVATLLNESTENNLVQTGLLQFITPPAGGNWPANTQNVEAIRYGSTDTVNIRIVNTSGVAGAPLPNTPLFKVTGLGFQISSNNTAPFAFDGYSIIPRNATDIEAVNPINPFSLVEPSNNTLVFVNDTATGKVVFKWNSTTSAQGLSAPVYSWQIDTAGGDFSTPLAMLMSNNVGQDTMIEITHGFFFSLLQGKGIATDKLLNLSWRVEASVDAFTKFSTETFTLDLKNSVNSGLTDVNRISFGMYPNPAHDWITFTCSEKMNTIECFDLSGKKLSSMEVNQSTQATMAVQHLKSGIYLIKVSTDKGNSYQKLVIE